MVAFGFIMHPRAYLRRQWELFEFGMVVLSWLQFVPAFPSLSMIRLSRIIPALQAASRIPGSYAQHAHAWRHAYDVHA